MTVRLDTGVRRRTVRRTYGSHGASRAAKTETGVALEIELAPLLGA